MMGVVGSCFQKGLIQDRRLDAEMLVTLLFKFSFKSRQIDKSLSMDIILPVFVQRDPENAA